MFRNQPYIGAAMARVYSFPFVLLFDFFSEVCGTADKEQDISTFKVLCLFKVSKEVCNQWLILYDARQIARKLRSNSTGATTGPIIEKSVS